MLISPLYVIDAGDSCNDSSWNTVALKWFSHAHCDYLLVTVILSNLATRCPGNPQISNSDTIFNKYVHQQHLPN